MPSFSFCFGDRVSPCSSLFGSFAHRKRRLCILITTTTAAATTNQTKSERIKNNKKGEGEQNEVYYFSFNSVYKSQILLCTTPALCCVRLLECEEEFSQRCQQAKAEACGESQHPPGEQLAFCGCVCMGVICSYEHADTLGRRELGILSETDMILLMGKFISKVTLNSTRIGWCPQTLLAYI